MSEKKSLLPMLCGTVLVCELLVTYFAVLVGFGLRPVPLVWVLAGAAGLAVLAIVAMALMPRRAGQRRPGVALGWAVQVLLLACGFVMPAMFVAGGVFAVMYAAAVYWGLKIDRMPVPGAPQN